MRLYLNLLPYQTEKVFGEIRDVISFIEVKLHLLEYFISFWNGNVEPKRPYAFIDTEDCHRAFLINANEAKMVSFGFEYIPKTNGFDMASSKNSIASFNYKGKHGKITAREISECLAVLSNAEGINKSHYLFEYVDGLDDSISNESKMLLESLFYSEPGYVRYDHDTIGYKENTHPIDHFDVNYNRMVSYKLGLRHQIKVEEFISLFAHNNTCPEVLLDSCKYPPILTKKKISKNKQKRRKNKIKKRK